MIRIVAVVIAVASPAAAGVYSPAESCPFEVAGGVAKPLPHPKFKSLLNDRRAELNPALPETEEIDTPDGKRQRLTERGRAMTRVRELSAKVTRLTPAERLALSADLVRTGTLGKEFALLKRVTGERPRDYLIAANYVHAETLAGNWGVAVRNFEDHVLELDRPTELPGTGGEQLAWMLGVDKKYYRPWLRVRRTEAARKGQSDGDPYPLFDGVTFTGSELSAEEKAKLPADAVAVAQQLVLWNPTDTGLLWLLAEVYAATGRLREADDAFDMCTWGAGMTGQKALMEHRRSVKAAVEKLPPPGDDLVIPPLAPPDPVDDGGVFAVVPRDKLLLFGGLFLAFAVGLLVLQVRAWRKRRGRTGG